MISISLAGLVVEVQSVEDAIAFFAGLTSVPAPGPRVVARRQTAVPHAPVEVDAHVLPQAEALQVQRLIAPKRTPRRRSPLVAAIAAEIEAAAVPPIRPDMAPEQREPRRQRAPRAPRVASAPPESTRAPSGSPHTFGSPRTFAECAEVILAAYRKNQAYDDVRLAAQLFGVADQSSIRRTKLMRERLVALKRLTRLGAMTYLVPEPELEEDDEPAVDDDVAGEPLDDEDEDLPRSFKDADTFGEDDDDEPAEDDEVEPAELAFD